LPSAGSIDEGEFEQMMKLAEQADSQTVINHCLAAPELKVEHFSALVHSVWLVIPSYGKQTSCIGDRLASDKLPLSRVRFSHLTARFIRSLLGNLNDFARVATDGRGML
jgi:hypothetical protein